MIPWKLFYLFMDAMSNTRAAEQLQMAQAVAHGAAMALNGKDHKVRQNTRRLARKAFPEVKNVPQE